MGREWPKVWPAKGGHGHQAAPSMAMWQGHKAGPGRATRAKRAMGQDLAVP